MAAGWTPSPENPAVWIRPDGTWFPDIDSAYRHMLIGQADASGGAKAVQALLASWDAKS